MLKLIITTIFATIIAQTMHVMFSKDASSIKEKKEIMYKITRKEGVLGCLSKGQYESLQKSYVEKKQDQIQEMIKNHQCFFYSYGEEVEGLSDICSTNNLNEIRLFSTAKFLFGKIYLPCFAVL